MRGLFKLYASFLMATQGRSGERLLFVEAWVFEGMTTTFAFDCRNTDGIENFMKWFPQLSTPQGSIPRPFPIVWQLTLIAYFRERYFLEVVNQFAQAFWSIHNNYASIDDFDSSGNRGLITRRSNMRWKTGRKWSRLWELRHAVSGQDILNVRHYMDVENSARMNLSMYESSTGSRVNKKTLHKNFL